MRYVVLILMLLTGPLAAQERFGALILGSQHFGDGGALNDFNPGLALGWRWSGIRGLEQSVEGGVFYNSYEEVSPFVLYGLSAEVARPTPDWSLRAGAFAGIALYEDLSEILEDDYGLPNVEGFIPIAGVTGIARWRDTTDVRLTLVPPGADVDLIVNLSLARRF